MFGNNSVPVLRESQVRVYEGFAGERARHTQTLKALYYSTSSLLPRQPKSTRKTPRKPSPLSAVTETLHSRPRVLARLQQSVKTRESNLKDRVKALADQNPHFAASDWFKAFTTKPKLHTAKTVVTPAQARNVARKKLNKAMSMLSEGVELNKKKTFSISANKQLEKMLEEV